MKSTKDRSSNQLMDLQLRPVSQDWNQVRFWSALDDPSEEKWDYFTRIPRQSVRENPRFDDDDDDFDAPRPKKKGSGSSTWLIAVLVVVCLAALGVGGYFVVTEFILPSAGAGASVSTGQGYMVKLGNRDLGIVTDQAAVKAYVDNLMQTAAQQAGVPVTMDQTIDYTPVTIDLKYIASTADVNHSIGYHASFTPQQVEPTIPDGTDTPNGGDTPDDGNTSDGGDDTPDDGQTPDATPA